MEVAGFEPTMSVKTTDLQSAEQPIAQYFQVAVLMGLKPTTSWLTTIYSNQLNYNTIYILAPPVGLEPLHIIDSDICYHYTTSGVYFIKKVLLTGFEPVLTAVKFRDVAQPGSVEGAVAYSNLPTATFKYHYFLI